MNSAGPSQDSSSRPKTAAAEEKPKAKPSDKPKDGDQREEVTGGYNEPKKSFHLPENHNGV